VIHIEASTDYGAVVRPIQILVMAVALLFFARVIRVASVQARPVGQVGGSRRRRSGNLSLEFIEPVERTGERVEISNPITVGRSPACDVSVQDTYISSRHVRLMNDAGELSIEDLGSTNGTYVNQELIKGRVQLERGDIVQVGGVIFEVVR
jgi:pSer/pThr/pTyr-binding forkhead associated (FHA) protein